MDRVAAIMVVGSGVWLLACSLGEAKARQSKRTEEASAMSAVEQAVRLSPEVVAREKATREWRDKLADTQWELELVLSGGAQPAVVQSDVLTFGRQAVGSEALRKTGYPDSQSYSLYAPTEESISWEAMQLKDGTDGQDVVIWRGEVIGEAIQGTVTKQRSRGEGETNLTEQFSFTGHKVVPAASEAAVPEAPSERSAAVPAPEASGANPAVSGAP